VPGFAYCWLELVSNRTLLPRLLGSPNREGWVLLEQLLCAGLRFLSPHLLRRPLRLRDSVRTLYRGCLRVLLVLLHDFPEFLCGHHAALCDAIPTGCVQMRNLVLSAFPRSMRLPDPFTPNLKVDMLPEIAHAPKVLCDVENIVCRGDGRLKASVDSYLRSRTPASLPTELCRSFFLPPREAAAMQTQHDVPAMNALVLYVGMVGVRAGTGPQVAQSPAIELLRRIAAGLDPEGRYHLLNAAANQLRYPNSHTHYFSCALLSLFLEPGGVESLPEQITRVLLERLIVNRPHPWGLLVTFIEQEADEQGCKQGDARELSSIMCDRLGSSNGSDEIETEIETEEESSSFQSDEPEAGAPQPPSATPAPSAASAIEALPMKIARWSASSLGQLACSQLSSGFLLESSVGPVDVLQLFGLLFVDPSFANALSAQERRLNLKLGEWAEGAAAGGATRSVQYTMRAIKVAGATIVPTCHVVERQVARYDESRGVLVVDCRVTSEGVPYADTFVTCVRYVLTGGQRAAGGGGGGGSSTLQISCAIDWLKAKPGMANVIEKSAVKTMKKTFDKAYRSELDRALSDHAARAAMR